MALLSRSEFLVWPIYKDGIHRQYGTEHFLVVGASGSGKTTLINMLMKSVFTSIPPFRAMVYDPKQEVLPYLYGLNATHTPRIKVLHPFDARSCAWDVAIDIDGPISARQFATILIPEREGGGNSDSFFTEAVRDLMTGVLLAFINCVPKANAWTFRDVVLAMLYEPYLRFLLNLDHTRKGHPFPQAARLRQSYLEGDLRTVSNIRASINSRLSIYEPIAAVWHMADRKFSLTHWAEEGCRDILVLGNDESGRAAIDAVNQAIFKRATELLLANRESTDDERDTGANQTWFFLDEVREAGNLDGLSRLLTKGRSKGACVVMGFQDIDGMRAAYGDEVAQEICGQCNNVAVLKLNSPSTAEWASELFGRCLAHSRSQSISKDRATGDKEESDQVGEEERPWLYTSDLLYLPPSSKANGWQGYFRVPDLDPADLENGIKDLRVHLDSDTVELLRPQPHAAALRAQLQRKRHGFSARVPRETSEQYLQPWDEVDWKRLGLDTLVPVPIAYNAPLHQQPQVHTKPQTLRSARSATT